MRCEEQAVKNVAAAPGRSSWHVFVRDVEAGQIYGFRAHRRFEPTQGLGFDPSKLLLGPYGRAVAVPKNFSRQANRLKGVNTGTARKSVVTDPPHEICEWHAEPPVLGTTYRAGARLVVVLIAGHGRTLGKVDHS